MYSFMFHKSCQQALIINSFCPQGGSSQARGAVERELLVRVQDVREREHRRARAGASARLRSQGVQR